jgi:hypothetical protein
MYVDGHWMAIGWLSTDGGYSCFVRSNVIHRGALPNLIIALLCLFPPHSFIMPPASLLWHLPPHSFIVPPASLLCLLPPHSFIVPPASLLCHLPPQYFIDELSCCSSGSARFLLHDRSCHSLSSIHLFTSRPSVQLVGYISCRYPINHEIKLKKYI